MDTVTSKAETETFTLEDFHYRIDQGLENKREDFVDEIQSLLKGKYPESFNNPVPEGQFCKTPSDISFEMSEGQFEDLISEIGCYY